jgi:hypothetical protein
VTITGSATLGKGEFAVRQTTFNFARDVEVSATVQGDGVIDIFTMSADEFDRFRDREDAVYHSGLTEEGVSDTTLSSSLPPGEHRLVFDNTAVFGTEPGGEVRFDFETVVSE